MLSDDSLQVPAHAGSRKTSLASSFKLALGFTSKDKRRQRHESNTGNNSSTHDVVRHTTAWRYMIVFGSFCTHFVADGVLFSFGILMHVIKDDLHLELHTVGVIASLFVSLPLLLAPLSGALVNKLGCRFMTMFGGFLCSMGLLFASFYGNFIGAVIGIGITCGAGLSCVYVSAVVIVAHYFDENRAIATAIAVGGTGLGNAIVAQLIHGLNDYYDDWRETTLFLSGVLFTIVGFGALFRPVEFSLHPKNKTSHRTMKDNRLPPSCMTSMEKLHRFIKEMDKQSARRHAHQSVSMSTSNHETIDSYSVHDLKELEDEFEESIPVTPCREKIPLSKFRYLLRNQSVNEKKSTEELDPSRDVLTRLYSLPQGQREKQLLKVYHQPISQKDIFYRGNVPVKSSNLSRTSCPDLIQSYVYEELTTSTSNDNHFGHRPRLLFYRKGLSFLHTLRRMLGLQLFRDYRYVIFFISQFLFYLFYDLIYIFPVDYGETVIGYTKKQMTMLVTVLGLGQFVGQLLFGLLANYTCIDELTLYEIGAVLCGIASFLIPFVAKSYTALILAILLFGLSISANYALTSVILANMCGLELLTSAYGLILLGQGLSSLFGPIIGGWIAEKYGYKLSLIIAGVFMGISGFVTLLIPLIRRLRGEEKDTNKDKTIETNTTTIRSDSFE